MSHTNRNFPEFHYSVEDSSFPYDDQIPQLNINTAQSWMSSGPRSVQHQVPSPSISTRTAMTAPDPRSFNRPGFHQANRSPIENPIDPHLPDLSMLNPSGHVARSYNPIARHFQDQPWSTSNLKGSNTIGGRNPLAQTNVQYGAYRGGPGSDIDSNVLPSDSGYYSQPPQSVFSNEPSRGGQELPSGITFKVGNLNVESAPSEAPMLAPMPSDQISQVSSRSGKSGRTLTCLECGETSKCKSDLKKHKLRHEKPYKCDFPKCKRAIQGFTTTNDLDRHKKSVHRIGLENKSYQCASENCRNKEKIWPRLDNFKQHVERMHPDEDELDLIRRSVFKEPTSVMESINVGPMDTTLAVAGMEKSFSSNPTMDPAPMIDISLDQDTRRWSSSGQKPDNFGKDTYGVSSHPRGLIVEGGLTHPHGSEDLHSQSYVYQRASGTTMRRDPQTLYTNAEEQIVPRQARLDGQDQRLHPSLSNAPQTKAEQQRSALQKQPRTGTRNFKSSKSEPVDLEKFVMSILHKATNLTNWDDLSPHQGKDIQAPKNSNAPIKLTQSEALKATQAISHLIKQSPGSGYVMQRRSAQDSLSNAKVCPYCDYAVARDCDLRKHMKRHEKPYGCTYPKCHKRFGAKSDWKRHENSQHFQVEAFRCAQPSSSSATTCGQYFFRTDPFKDHLRNCHKVSDPDHIAKEVELCTIGKNCQGRFWCGFCTEVRELKERQNAAWDERFDHIAHHFEKEKRSIDDWICVQENRTKKESLKEVNREGDVLEDEEDRDIDAIGEDDDEMLPASLVAPIERPMPRSVSPLPPSQVSQQSYGKRQRSTESSTRRRPTKQRRMNLDATMLVTSNFCCRCSDGPFSSLQPACASCGHELCITCPSENAYMESGC